MDLKLTWELNNPGLVTTKIYRSDEPLNLEALPEPIAVLSNSETEYVDIGLVRDKYYYYVFETVTADDRAFSRVLKIQASPRRGPGPQLLKYGNLNLGFYGKLIQSEFISFVKLANSVGFTGTVSTTSPIWYKYARKGKIIYVPDKPAGSGVSWLKLYESGLVYGTDDFGKGMHLPANQVLQNKKVKIGPDWFRVRLMTGYDESDINLLPSASDATDVIRGKNEWDDFIYPMTSTVFYGQRFPNLAQTAIGGIGGNLYYCQESDSSSCLFRGAGTGNAARLTTKNTTGRSTNNASYHWWPVLELIEN